MSKEVWSDQGKAFVNEMLERLSRTCGFKQKLTSGYHPETNGSVERMNRTLQEMLAKANPDQQKWDEELSKVVWVYNTSKHSSTGFSPYEIIHGCQARMPEDTALLPERPQQELSEQVETTRVATQRIQQQALSNQEKAAEAQKEQYDKHVKEKVIEAGDLVRWYRGHTRTGHSTKLNCPWTGPWTVVRKVGKVDYHLKDLQGRVAKGLAHEQDLIKVDEEHGDAEVMF